MESNSNNNKLIIRQFLLWGGLFRFSVGLSAAFFLIYMIKNIGLSTTEYAILCAAPFFSRALFQRNWNFASKGEHVYYGIQIATGFIALLPWLWILSTHFYYLFFLQILAGLFWGGLELTHLLMAQLHSYGNSRQILGVQQAVFRIFSVAGAIIGGFLIDKNWTF